MNKIQKNKAGFITKLQAILTNQELLDIITWNIDGNSFLIFDSTIFQQLVLTTYFRHKRISSFIRQLNMYGFHKIRSQKYALQFYHPYFKKQHPELYHYIQRKKPSQIEFKENIVQNLSKQSITILISDKILTSIKVIQDECQYNNYPSFRFNGSKMTIKFDINLTSLGQVQCDDQSAHRNCKTIIQNQCEFEQKVQLKQNCCANNILYQEDAFKQISFN